MRMMEPIARFDLAFSLFCVRHRFSYPIARISKVVSQTGDGHLYALLGVGAWLLDTGRGAVFLSSGLMAFAIELPLYLLFKHLFQRRRPHDLMPSLTAFIQPSDQFSLPSGHTSAAFLMANLCHYLYPGIEYLAFFWAGCIGLARILLGVHFFTDILAGALLGVGAALAGVVVVTGGVV